MGNESKEVEVLDSRGFTTIQALILSVLSNPGPCVKARGSVSASNIAKHIGKQMKDVHKAYEDPNFIDALSQGCLARFHAARAQIDGALIESASIPNSYGTADRKLYYSMILPDGSVNRNVGEGGDSFSREDKLKFLKKFLTETKENYGSNLRSIGPSGQPIDTDGTGVVGSREGVHTGEETVPSKSPVSKPRF